MELLEEMWPCGGNLLREQLVEVGDYYVFTNHLFDIFIFIVGFKDERSY